MSLMRRCVSAGFGHGIYFLGKLAGFGALGLRCDPQVNITKTIYIQIY